MGQAAVERETNLLPRATIALKSAHPREERIALLHIVRVEEAV